MKNASNIVINTSVVLLTTITAAGCIIAVPYLRQGNVLDWVFAEAFATTVLMGISYLRYESVRRDRRNNADYVYDEELEASACRWFTNVIIALMVGFVVLALIELAVLASAA